MLSFLEAGLEDLSVSRTSFTWGIPVPDDPAHVMYVWFDALTNYMTAVGYGSDDPADAARFAHYWPADVHLIGKEIVRQHAIYWPAFLLAAELPLPRQIVSHGWWLMDGAKMSKSKGNVVRPRDYIERFGLDAVRYFVFREMVFGQDASFTDEAILTRYNADLANDLGNLVSRVTTMVHRYCEGRMPAPDRGLLARPEEQQLTAAADVLVSEREERGLGLSAQRRAARHLGVRRRHEPLHRRARAVEAGEGAGTAGGARDVAVRAGRRPPRHRGAAAAVHAVGRRSDAGDAGTGASAEVLGNICAPGHLAPGTPIGEPAPLFPRIELSVEELERDGKRHARFVRAGWRRAAACRVHQRRTRGRRPGCGGSCTCRICRTRRTRRPGRGSDRGAASQSTSS